MTKKSEIPTKQMLLHLPKELIQLYREEAVRQGKSHGVLMRDVLTRELQIFAEQRKSTNQDLND